MPQHTTRHNFLGLFNQKKNQFQKEEIAYSHNSFGKGTIRLSGGNLMAEKKNTKLGTSNNSKSRDVDVTLRRVRSILVLDVWLAKQ